MGQTLHAEGSPNLHLKEFNPHLDADGFPADFTPEGVVCHYDSALSGVSSFGFGGTNAHAISYGKNVYTTRGAGQKDYKKSMREKIAFAPPMEVMMLGDNPEDWESNGMPVDEDKIGKTYQVEINEKGNAIWREVVAPPPTKSGTRFFLSADFNKWGTDLMTPDEEIPDLYTIEVRMSNLGEILFNII